LEERDQKQLLQFQKKFWEGIDLEAARLERYVTGIHQLGMDKKRWAIEVMPQFREQQNPAMVGFVFSMFDGKNARDIIVDHIRKNMNTQTKINEIRYLWGNEAWSYTYESEA
jgi:hypothetical protein